MPWKIIYAHFLENWPLREVTEPELRLTPPDNMNRTTLLSF